MFNTLYEQTSLPCANVAKQKIKFIALFNISLRDYFFFSLLNIDCLYDFKCYCKIRTHLLYLQYTTKLYVVSVHKLNYLNI